MSGTLDDVVKAITSDSAEANAHLKFILEMRPGPKETQLFLAQARQIARLQAAVIALAKIHLHDGSMTPDDLVRAVSSCC